MIKKKYERSIKVQNLNKNLFTISENKGYYIRILF